MIHGIDPGTHESAIVSITSQTRGLVFARILPNDEMRDVIRRTVNPNDEVAIEMVACYGMPVGHETFETCLWIGRFIECSCVTPRLITRNAVKMALCYTIKGVNDAAVRQRLIDLYSAADAPAIGTKKAPGPLYSIKSHMWPALAVAITHLATRPKPGEMQ